MKRRLTMFAAWREFAAADHHHPAPEYDLDVVDDHARQIHHDFDRVRRFDDVNRGGVFSGEAAGRQLPGEQVEQSSGFFAQVAPLQEDPSHYRVF